MHSFLDCCLVHDPATTFSTGRVETVLIDAADIVTIRETNEVLGVLTQSGWTAVAAAEFAEDVSSLVGVTLRSHPGATYWLNHDRKELMAALQYLRTHPGEIVLVDDVPSSTPPVGAPAP